MEIYAASRSLFARMQPNQAIFVMHLRTNPNEVDQISGELVNSSGQMCALGLGMEAFDLIRRYEEKKNSPSSAPAGKYGLEPLYDPYKEIAAVLDMPVDHVHQVYALNDDHEQTFAQIADIMEEYFSQPGGLHSYSSKGPEEIFNEHEEERVTAAKLEFVTKWNEVKRAHERFLEEAAAKLGVTTEELDGATLQDEDPEDFFYDYVNEED
jgi:hypothetical protein